MLSYRISAVQAVVVLFLVLIGWVCGKKAWASFAGHRRPKTKRIQISNPISGGLSNGLTIALVVPCIPEHVTELRKLIQSIEKQTRLPDEVVVAISETDEKTALKLSKDLSSPKITVTVSGIAGKAYAGKNRNRGAALTHSDLISFIDADDQMHPQRLEILLAVYGKTRSRVLLHTYVMHENGEELPGHIENVEVFGSKTFHSQHKEGAQPHFEHWPFQSPLHHGHVTIEKELLASVKQNEDMKRGQDADFLRRILTEFENDGRAMCGIDFQLSMYQPRYSTRDPEALNVRFVVASCNETPEYLAAIPQFIQAWQTFYPSVSIKIIMVMTSIPDNLKIYTPYFVLFPPLAGVSTVFTSQYIRILYPPLLPGDGGIQAGGVVLTDIDLLPTNNTYFSNATFAGLTTTSFVNMRGDSQVPKDQIAIAYSVATPLIWQQINGVTSIEVARKKLHMKFKNTKYKDGREIGWESDQKALFTMVQEWKKKGGDYATLNSKQTGFHRLHKSDLSENEGDLLKGELSSEVALKLRRGVYSDYHMIHPVGKYAVLDNKIFEAVMEGTASD